MGAAQSKSKSMTDIVNESVTNIMVENSSLCSQSSTANQEMSFSDIKAKGCTVNFNDISQDAKITTNFTCMQNAEQNADMANKFSAEIDKKLSAELKGLPSALISNSETESITKVRNKITANISLSNVAKCISDSMMSQKQQFGKIDVDCTGAVDKSLNFKNISQKLISTNVAKCVQANQQVAESVNELDTILKEKQEAANKGWSLFDTSSLMVLLIPCIICIVLSVISSVAGMFMAKSKGLKATDGLDKIKDIIPPKYQDIAKLAGQTFDEV